MAKREIVAKAGWTLVCLGLMAAVALSPAQQQAQAGKASAPIMVAHPSVAVSIKLDKSLFSFSKSQNHIGSLHAVLCLTNNSANPVTFSEHGRRYEWQIVDDQHKVVWDYAVGRAFPHFVLLRTLDAGSHLDYPIDIPLQDQTGLPLPAGRYTLRGRVSAAVGTWTQTGFTVTEAR